jgi:hypothetical protein
MGRVCYQSSGVMRRGKHCATLMVSTRSRRVVSSVSTSARPLAPRTWPNRAVVSAYVIGPSRASRASQAALVCIHHHHRGNHGRRPNRDQSSRERCSGNSPQAGGTECHSRRLNSARGAQHGSMKCLLMGTWEPSLKQTGSLHYRPACSYVQDTAL